MEIGGFFSYEDVTPVSQDFVTALCPQAGDTAYLMSGRCAIYFCLQDSMLQDTRRVAYLPAYTCETVTGCFVKAGYRILYYDVDETLTPLFDRSLIPQVSILLICGYYGYSTYDREFVRLCRDTGITVMQDITQTAFSPNGVCPDTDYIVASMRKWMGVPSGGVAIKRQGRFGVTPTPADQEHLALRRQAMELGHTYRQNGDETLNQTSFDLFWKAEWMLRQIFDAQESDPTSPEIIRHYPVQEAVCRRRENYGYLLEHLGPDLPVRPFFLSMPEDTCPMHFAFLCEHREYLKAYLKEHGIAANIYWPVPPFIHIEDYPHAHYVYDHVMSICCDQRFTPQDMQHVLDVLRAYCPPSSEEDPKN